MRRQARARSRMGGAALLIALPVYLLCALAIKLDTPGPVLYCSTRVGLGGRTFTFYKLRSMVHGADKSRHQIAHLNEVSGPVFKIARDPRITRVGRILRRTSLDELPQILQCPQGGHVPSRTAASHSGGGRPVRALAASQALRASGDHLSVAGERTKPARIRRVDAVGHGIRRAPDIRPRPVDPRAHDPRRAGREGRILGSAEDAVEGKASGRARSSIRSWSGVRGKLHSHCSSWAWPPWRYVSGASRANRSGSTRCSP